MTETVAELRAATRVERPTILVLVNDRLLPSQLDELRYGIEEEGIPHSVRFTPELDPLALAHAAAVESRLGVGIGVSLEWAVVTTEKLPPARPYLVQPLNHSRARDRTLGTNAARIVKRMPLAGTAHPGEEPGNAEAVSGNH